MSAQSLDSKSTTHVVAWPDHGALPTGAQLVGVWELYVGIDTLEEAAYFCRRDGWDELWVVTGCGLDVPTRCRGRAAPHSPTCKGWPSDRQPAAVARPQPVAW